ncbi:MAG: hypothetical protein R3F02_01190 [Thiolinea sp.]
MKHLLVDISAHGFGHLAQTAAVLNALDTRNIRLTIRSLAPERILRERIRHPFQLIPYLQDNGVIMHDALRVDAEASMDWYVHFHAGYEQRKQQAVAELEALQPDLLFADVPYLSLDAAGACAVPSLALCSLNWADIFQHYCGHFPGAAEIHAQILHAYAQAKWFLQATPSMPMDDLSNTRSVAPIALTGKRQPDWLRGKTGCGDKVKFVLVALGGIGIEYPLEQWPQLENVCWIFPDQALTLQRDDFFPQSLFGLDYVDLLSSCDLVLTKTGYGTQTEAVINQVPALCVRRDGWPEQPFLFDWHQQHGEVSFIDWQRIQSGDFADDIAAALKTSWTKPAVLPDGARQTAAIIVSCL